MNGIWAHPILSSVNPAGIVLTTLEVSFPRYILPEVNTHRDFSRNTASHRALPAKHVIQQALDNPFVPSRFPIEERGMTAKQWCTAQSHPQEFIRLTTLWLQARDRAVDIADTMMKRCVHHQLVNRILEPFAWTRMLISSTKWQNFLNLRRALDADDHIRLLADCMHGVMAATVPTPLAWGQWHLPFVQPDEADMPIHDRIRLCVGRCARTSYLTHDKRRDVQRDFDLHDDLRRNWHMSPTEHAAVATKTPGPGSNFDPTWLQYRKTIRGEDVAPEEKP